MFRIGDIIPPYTEDEGQDAWVGKIDTDGHTGCVEVYMFEDNYDFDPEKTRQALVDRLEQLVKALNGDEGDFDRAMDIV